MRQRPVFSLLIRDAGLWVSGMLAGDARGFFSAINSEERCFCTKVMRGPKPGTKGGQVDPRQGQQPVRAFRSVEMNPVYIERGEGSRVFDVDGNEVHRLSLFLGAPDSRTRPPEGGGGRSGDGEKRGTSFGLPTELETEMARSGSAGSLGGSGAHGQLGNGSDHERPAAGPGVHPARQDPQV